MHSAELSLQLERGVRYTPAHTIRVVQGRTRRNRTTWGGAVAKVGTSDLAMEFCMWLTDGTLLDVRTGDAQPGMSLNVEGSSIAEVKGMVTRRAAPGPSISAGQR